MVTRSPRAVQVAVLPHAAANRSDADGAPTREPVTAAEVTAPEPDVHVTDAEHRGAGRDPFATVRPEHHDRQGPDGREPGDRRGGGSTGRRRRRGGRVAGK